MSDTKQDQQARLDQAREQRRRAEITNDKARIQKMKQRLEIEQLMNRKPTRVTAVDPARYDLERAILAYRRGHQWMDAARRYQVPPTRLREVLNERGYWRVKENANG